MVRQGRGASGTLNGFPNDTLHTGILVQIAPVNAAAILAALQVDGKLVGTIVDADPLPNATEGNFLTFPNAGIIGTTVLNIEGDPIPEPGTLLLLGSGLASLALRRRRCNDS